MPAFSETAESSDVAESPKTAGGENAPCLRRSWRKHGRGFALRSIPGETREKPVETARGWSETKTLTV